MEQTSVASFVLKRAYPYHNNYPSTMSKIKINPNLEPAIKRTKEPK